MSLGEGPYTYSGLLRHDGVEFVEWDVLDGCERGSRSHYGFVSPSTRTGGTYKDDRRLIWEGL